MALNSKPTAARGPRATRRRAARPPPSRSTTPTTTSRRPSARPPQVLDALPRHRARAATSSRLIDGTARTTGALIRNENALQGPDHELQHDDGGVRAPSPTTCSRRSASCRRRWRPPTARSRRSTRRSRPRARSRARSSRASARRRRRSTPAFPWIAPGAPADGPGGARRPGARSWRRPPPTSRSADRRARSSCCRRPTSRRAARRDVVLPTGDVVIQDEFTTGVENYKEFFYTLVGLAGEGQNFDGNGMYVRFQTGGGSQTRLARLGQPPARPAVRQHVAVAARQPAGLSGQAAAVQADAPPATSRRGRTSTARPPPRRRRPAPAAAAAAKNALPLLRKKLRPFGSKKDGRASDAAIRKHLQRLRRDHRPADRRR